jgi:hypothetical protein
MRLRFTVLLPVAYGCLAFWLLKYPLNWFAPHAFYVISWPVSHLFAREQLIHQACYGLVQWVVIGVITDIVFNPSEKQ